MKKFFTVWVLVVCMLISMTVTAAGVENVDSDIVGDVYELSPEGWPMCHWYYMSEDEITDYESRGWERYVGVLWYNEDNHAVNSFDVKASKIQEWYNNGYTCHVIYTWICPADAFNSKFGEQSVSVGHWVLSPEQAVEYHKTYKIPEICELNEVTTVMYESGFYYNGLACEVTGGETEELLNKVMFVRHEYAYHDFGYGSRLYLRTGEADSWSYNEVIDMVNQNAIVFQNEIPVWN